MENAVFGIGVGIFIGMILLLAIYILVEPSHVDSADDIDEPEELYIVTVDDLMFHCTNRPILREARIRLVGCSEMYGRTVIIKNYTSYSLVLRTHS